MSQNLDANPDVRDATPVEQADVKLGTELARHRDAPALRAADKVGSLGDQEPLYAASAALLVFGLLTGSSRARSAGLRVLAATATADLIKSGVKRVVSRTRPHVLMDEGRYDMEAGGEDSKSRQSFPSGHTAGTVAAARALAGVVPQAAVPAYAFAALVAGTRVAKGAHYPLDVAAGAAVGLVAEVLSGRLITALGRALGR